MNSIRKTKIKRILKRLDGKLVLKRKKSPTLEDVKKVVAESNTLQKSRFGYVLDKLRSVKPEIKLETKVIEVIKPELRTEVKEIIKEEKLDTKELKKVEDRLKDEIDTLRNILSNLGGGQAHRRITVGGTESSNRYADVNFIAGTNVSITLADDNTNKRVNFTIAASGGGGVSFETPVGDVNDTNMTFTVTNTPKYINVNGLIYTVGNGIFTSYVAPTITLNTPVGTGGFIQSAYE